MYLIDLFWNDKNHAGPMGSYLSACVHYSMIFGEKCYGNKSRKIWKTNQITKIGPERKLSDKYAKRLQKVADMLTGTKTKRSEFRFGENEDCKISMCTRGC